MRKRPETIRNRKRKDSFQHGKNRVGNSGTSNNENLVAQSEKCQRDLGELLLKSREQTHEILVRLFVIALAFSSSRKQYRKFAHHGFFSGYGKKMPKPSDGLREIFSNVLRFAYNASHSKANGYRAANRYAKILRKLAEEGCPDEEVRQHLRKKDANSRWDIQPMPDEKEVEFDSGVPDSNDTSGPSRASKRSSKPQKPSSKAQGAGAKKSAKSAASTGNAAKAGPTLNLDFFRLFPNRSCHAELLQKASGRKGTVVRIKAVVGHNGDLHTTHVTVRKPRRTAK